MHDKILLLSEIFPPQNGGSGRWFWEIYRRFDPNQVFVAAGQFERADNFDSAHDIAINRLPLSISQWGLKSIAGLKGYWRNFRSIRKLVRAEQVTQVHAGRCLHEGWCAYLLSLWCDIGYTVYVHGEDIESAAKSRELTWMTCRIFKNADRVISNSHNTARLLNNNWPVDPDKLTVLHPGVDTQVFKPRENQKFREQTEWNDRQVILTVGRLQQRKGHDMLIRALLQIRQAFPRVLYAIVGDGGERDQLQTLARDLGVQEYVQFLNEISDQDLVSAYQNCDIFALPNREIDGDIEGFGMVLLEAQACGKPVLAGDSGGTSETMTPEKTGIIVDCKNPTPIAHSLIGLLSQPSRRATMGAAAREWVVENFDWEPLAKQASELFGIDLRSRCENKTN